MRRPSEILVRLEFGNKDITGVHVGGKATAAKEKNFELLDADSIKPKNFKEDRR
jgi:hypothetical protein